MTGELVYGQNCTINYTEEGKLLTTFFMLQVASVLETKLQLVLTSSRNKRKHTSASHDSLV